MPPKKKKKKKVVDENAATMDDVAKSVKNYVRGAFEDNKVADKHQIVTKFNEWAEEAPNITQIMFDCPMPPPSIFVRAVTQSLVDNRWSKITQISFLQSNMRDVGAEALADTIPRLESITCLRLVDAGFGPEACVHLARMLYDPKRTKAQGGVSPKNLKYLHLDHNPLTSLGVEILEQALSLNTNITKLTLSYCQLDSSCGTALSNILSNFDGKLEELDLEGNDLRNDGIEAFAAAVGCSPKLKKLNLKLNGLSDQNVLFQLGESFKSNKELTKINLDGNFSREECDAPFAALFEQMKDTDHIVDLEIPLFVSQKTYAQFCDKFKAKKKGKKKKGGKKKKKKS